MARQIRRLAILIEKQKRTKLHPVYLDLMRLFNPGTKKNLERGSRLRPIPTERRGGGTDQ